MVSRPTEQEPALCITLELVRAQHSGDPFAFQAATQRYLLRNKDGGFKSTELPWDAGFLCDLEAIRQPTRDPVVAQRIGETLRRFMDSVGWSKHEPAILEAVQAQRRVILTLRLAAAELFSLPWELLVLRATGQHIGELPNVLLRYEWPQTQATLEAPSPRPEHGRILVAWSAAAGAVPASEHIEAITQAAHASAYPFDPDQDVLAQVSMARLANALSDAQRTGRLISVLHILCHGGEVGDSFGLMLDGNEPGDGPALIDAARLRQCLAPFSGMVRLVVLSACDSGNSGAVANQLGSVAQNLHRAGFACVLASRYPLSVSGSIVLTRAVYHELLAESRSLEEAVLHARAQLSIDANQFDWASLLLFAHEIDRANNRPVVFRPYRGLLSFQAEQHRFFAGREHEVEEIIGDLKSLGERGKPRVLVVAGASGTGKSSLVLAGVIPRLQAETPAPQILRMRPGQAPLQVLTQQLSLRREIDPCVLVIDQLEELFTHCESRSERSEFTKRLWQTASSSPQLSIIVTLRVDFIGQCGELLLDEDGLSMDRIVYDEAHRSFVSQLPHESLVRVISEPAQRCGLTLEAGLLNRILQDLGNQPGGLPLLQDTLDLLWQRRSDNTLTQSAYDAIGGASGALTGRADALIQSLSPAEQSTARRLLVRLVQIGRDVQDSTRRRMPLGRLRPQSTEEAKRFDAVLSRFVQQRLITCDGEGDTQTVEVAHEALIRTWKPLSEWVREDRKRLGEFEKLDAWVRQWQEQGTLLVAAQLAYAKDLVQRYPEDATPDARLLVKLSQKRARRRQLIRSGIAVVLLVGSVISALTARYALQQSSEARLAAQRSRALQLLSAAQDMKHDVSALAAVLREVDDPQPQLLPGWLSDANWALRQPARMIREYTAEHSSFQSLVVHPARDEFLSTSIAGEVHVWSIAGQGDLFSLHDRAALSAAVYSPDGQYVAAVGQSGDVCLWQLPDPRSAGSAAYPRKQILSDLPEPGHSLGFNRDGTTLFVLYASGRLRIWSLRASPHAAQNTPLFAASRHELANLPHPLRLALWMPDGSHMLLVPERGAAELWNLASAVRVRAFHSPDLSTDLTVQRAAISPDGTHIALAYSDRRIRLFDAHHPTTPPTIFDAQSGPITQLAFSSDGTRLLSGSTDRAVHLWTRTQASPVHIFRAGGAITAVQFSPDGASLLYAADDGQAHLQRRAGERWTAIALRGHRDAIRDARFLSDGKRVLTISDDYGARLWGIDDVLDPKTVWWTPSRPQHITLSREGAYAAAAQGSDVLLWTRATGHVTPLRGHREAVVYAAFSPDSLQLVTVGNDYRALIWKTADGRQLRDIAVEPGTRRAALSHDLTLLATATEQRAQVTKIDSQSRTWTFVGHRQRIESLLFTPSGHGLLTTSADRSARLWKLTDTLDSVVLRQHVDTVTSAAYGLHDSDLFTGSADRRIQRSASSDYNTYVVTDRVEQLALDGPAQRIVAAAHDGTAHIFSIHGAALPIVLHSEEEDAQPPQPLSAAVFTESGEHVLTASADGTVRQWALHDDIAALRRALWDVSPFCLSAPQRQQRLYESLLRANASQHFCTEFMRCIGKLPDPGTPRSPLPFEQCLQRYRETMQEIRRWM